MTPTSHTDTLTGLGYALAAFSIWGLFPVYWKWLAHVSALEILGHRILWTIPFVALAVTVMRRWARVKQLLQTPKQVAGLMLSAVLVSINWLVFVWAVAHHRILEASLGYYLLPLVSVLLGWLVFQERLRLWQWLAVGFAVLGVAVQLVGLGYLPWIALAVSLSFGCYGAVRKHLPADPVTGLFIEVLLISPFALLALFAFELQGTAQFLHLDWQTDILLIIGGLVTATPLLFHTGATRRLRLTTVGLLSYLTPTLQLLLGVFVYQEAISLTQWLSFIFIWCGLVIYSIASRTTAI